MKKESMKGIMAFIIFQIIVIGISIPAVWILTGVYELQDRVKELEELQVEHDALWWEDDVLWDMSLTNRDLIWELQDAVFDTTDSTWQFEGVTLQSL